nr:hypothetical protein [Tanacetum cinerariifolium]
MKLVCVRCGKEIDGGELCWNEAATPSFVPAFESEILKALMIDLLITLTLKKIFVSETRSDTGAQTEGQDGSNPDETSEGQAGSNPDETSEGQAGADPGNAEARVQSTLSHVVHAGSDREHMDLDVANVSPQPSMEQLYEGFNATVYLNVQENLKLAIEEPVLLEEPASLISVKLYIF